PLTFTRPITAIMMIRQMRFKGVKRPEGQISFYLEADFPGEMKSDGRIWRMKVSQNSLKTDELNMTGGGAVVGVIPRGLPKLEAPKIDFGIVATLLPMTAIISLLGFMEAISIAKAMAAKTGQRLDPNQELIGQGLANMVGSVSKSYAVSGSFSRSAVNLQAGAVTGLSSVFSSFVVVLTLLFFTPLLFHLPQSVLAAIIMMAVIGLVNVSGFIHAWRAQKYDGVIGVITFVTTLAFAPHLDRGIMIGIALSVGLSLLRNMRPDIALLSLHYDGSYRGAEKNGLEKCRHIAVVRFNGSLFFANVSYLESSILEQVSSMPSLKHIVIVCNGINELDASGEEMLSLLVARLREAGYGVSFSGFNDHVLDVIRRTHLYAKIGEENIFRSIFQAVSAVHDRTHVNSTEQECPIFAVVPVEARIRRYAVDEKLIKDIKRFERPDDGGSEPS
ncbi:SulP family inorganic anion transporter, partial [Acidobacteriota bacterium]